MPSWNIHIAHAEGLLADGGPVADIVCDRNAFLFGNLIPDVYVGYMVPCVVYPIPYRVTHFAAPEHIPKPREGEFWDTYVAPMVRELGISFNSDAVVGRVRPAAEQQSPAVEQHVSAAGQDRPVAEGGVVAQASAAFAAQASAAAGSSVFGQVGSLKREVAHVSPAHTPTHELEFPPEQSAQFQIEAFEAARPASMHETARPDSACAAVHPASALDAACPAGAPADERRALFDLVLGTWVHLLADTIWNQRVNDYLDELGEVPSKDFRIKKQGDFDQFGKSLPIDAFPVPNPQLINTAARFPQYAIDERSVYFSCAIAHEIVRTNSLTAPPAYRLLTQDFFTATFGEVQRSAAWLMRERL